MASEEKFRAVVVSSEAGPEIALLQTADRPAILSRGDPEAARCAARSEAADLSGITGPADVADAFSEAWCAYTSGSAHLHWETTFYTLDRVTPFQSPQGRLERAQAADLAELQPLAVHAARDMNLPAAEQDPEEVEKRVRRNIAGGRQFLWREGSSIQSIAGYAEAPGDGGARIGMVYTRPELRGRGYGTAVTGSLAQMLLDQGQTWVCLFADNANPNSNRIYRRLGFQPEVVYRTWLFTA
jgi:predicted GNAT family acetyltransferase